MIKLTLPDGGIREFDAPVVALEAVKSISQGLAKAAVGCFIDGVASDLSAVIDADASFVVLTFESEIGDAFPGRQIYWHTTSHIMAQAVKRLYPAVKVAIGPSVDNGFYYDFEKEGSFSAEDLAAIEKEMGKIISENLPIERFTLGRAEALELMKDEPYKIELIGDLPEDAVLSFYRQGEYVDLCTGPHLPSTGRVKAYKLMSSTGAYWRGKSDNIMLSRIYGVSYPKKDLLDAYIERVEQAKLRDHNKLGRELEYFTTVDYIGQGLPILMPKGARVIQLLQRFVEDEEEKRGYLLTKTPFMAKRELYKISGHWDHYRDGMFVLGDADDEETEVFALRPMTCPFQFQVYLARMRSWRDLPMRFNETSTLFRNEESGEMHGLIRVRQFTISEGHIACMPEQLETEFKDCVDLAMYMLTTLGLDEDVSFRFSKWDENDKEKYIGDAEQWESVQNRMRAILDNIGIDYKEASGEAAFYGPKLDIQIRNVHGKEDTLITIQIDFALAERFGMEYVDADGQKKYPYVIHRTSIGCYERTLALLIEKYAGALPTWLAPLQVKLLPIGNMQHDYAYEVEKKLKAYGIRCETDDRSEKIGYKIRQAQLEKVPYMLVIGDKEIEAGAVAVRSRKAGDVGAVAVETFVEGLVEEIRTRAR